ncbi:MAG: serine/threonine-protein kinase, partial [Pseudomonadota bacterium]
MNLPELFGPYLLHHRLAQGNTSEVFLAQTTGEYPRICAIKRILPQLTAMPEFHERFRKDAALLVRMQHGNTVQVLEVGEIEEKPFIAMEQIDGIDFPQLISQVSEQGPLPPEFALYVGLEMCEATTYLYLRRQEEDKCTSFPFDQPWPLEVMLGFDGVVKIVDLGSFGALRLGQQKPSRLFRSPGYAVPEVILKRPLDVRSDVFATGLVIWEALSGTRLVATDPESYIRQVVQGTWEAPLITRKDVPGIIIQLVSRMLSLDPDKRPLSLEEPHEQLVAGLRRLAPSYGSAALSRLLWWRCQLLVGRLEALTTDLVRGSQTLRVPTPVMFDSFSHSSFAKRHDEPPKAPKVGDRIPGTRYRLVRHLGAGGNAEVFAAQHVDLDRQVAVKVLSFQFAQNEAAKTQFRMEARACGRVAHPNIVDVIDFGELDDGRFFFAMELLEGESLADLLDRAGPLPPGRTIGIFRQICRALQAAHEQGIVHRDVKPDNIMLIRKGGRPDFVKVLDFGVMAFTNDSSGQRVGTPGFMAPEQVLGDAPAPAMDIYALGATLYTCLCRKLPYSAGSLKKYVSEQERGDPPLLRTRIKNIPAALERVVHKALARNPEQRHRSMAHLEADLIQAQQESGLTSTWDDLSAPHQRPSEEIAQIGQQ